MHLFSARHPWSDPLILYQRRQGHFFPATYRLRHSSCTASPHSFDHLRSLPFLQKACLWSLAFQPHGLPPRAPQGTPRGRSSPVPASLCMVLDKAVRIVFGGVAASCMNPCRCSLVREMSEPNWVLGTNLDTVTMIAPRPSAQPEARPRARPTQDACSEPIPFPSRISVDRSSAPPQVVVSPTATLVLN